MARGATKSAGSGQFSAVSVRWFRGRVRGPATRSVPQSVPRLRGRVRSPVTRGHLPRTSHASGHRGQSSPTPFRLWTTRGGWADRSTTATCRPPDAEPPLGAQIDRSQRQIRKVGNCLAGVNIGSPTALHHEPALALRLPRLLRRQPTVHRLPCSCRTSRTDPAGTMPDRGRHRFSGRSVVRRHCVPRRVSGALAHRPGRGRDRAWRGGGGGKRT